MIPAIGRKLREKLQQLYSRIEQTQIKMRKQERTGVLNKNPITVQVSAFWGTVIVAFRNLRATFFLFRCIRTRKIMTAPRKIGQEFCFG